MRRTRPTTVRAPRRGALRGSPALRLKVGFVLIAMVLSVFAARLVQLQGLDPSDYAQMAAAEGQRTVVLPAQRGEILDRNGEPLADSVEGRMIIADPLLTRADAPELAKFLSTRLGVDYFEVLERLRKEGDGDRFQYIARQVPASTATAVVDAAGARGYEGLTTESDPVRAYPARDVAANLVGFLGTPLESGAAQPLAGFEDTFDRYLSGRDGEATFQSSSGNRIPLGDSTLTDAVDGHDLSTTIDRDLQWYSQRLLARTVRQYGAESAFAVIMDSRTGEVLAMPDVPTYDAANPLDSPKELFQSRAMSETYEPGSVHKVLTVGALIDAGHLTPRTRITVPPVLMRQDRPIGDWFDHGTIRLTLAGVLAKSSNIGTVKAADQFGQGEMRRYLEEFGLGSRTDVGVIGESAGILPSGSLWTSQTEDRIAFGQSVSVNALQMAAAVNTVANGGERIDPSLVRGSATTDEGVDVGTEQAERRQVISEQAAHQTMLMMERVIDPVAGVAPSAAVPGYRVAGKTGTAQRVNTDCGCYDGTTTVSFAGFAPADDPRFTVYVVVQNPQSGGGGSVAGPAFSELMGFTLRRYQVPPTGTEPSRLPVEW